MEVWLIIAGVLVIVELTTATFYVLMFALGAAAGAYAAYAGFSLSYQLFAAALVSVIGTYAVNIYRKRFMGTKDSESNPDINIDIGQKVEVPEWIQGRARVMYRGALWDAELATGENEQSGVHTITKVRGSTLVLSNNN